MILNNWKMTYRDHSELPCTAPCSMYSVLYENGIIEDPFYGLNEQKYTSLSDYGCSFTCNFDADDAILTKDYIELIFYGIDTICDITLNGKLLASTKNMHRTYVYDIKDKLSKGANILKLDFKSPTKYFEAMNKRHHIYTNLDTIKGAAHLRKALYMSGWDWGPMLPDMGIFRPVEIRAYDCDRIDNMQILQHHEDGEVTLEVTVNTRRNAGCDTYVQCDGKRIKAENGKAMIKIDNPKLWWARGYGEQPLYDISAEIEVNGNTISHLKQRIGLRTLDVSIEPDDLGSEFCFVINGVKIFAMGANYVPQDNLLSRISPERTRKLIDAAIDANFNCLRIWGGQYYPEDEFYDYCDEKGVLVWEDFMIACANVWLTDEIRAELTAELTDNIIRLRNHPSLGIFCGNNEMEQGVLLWEAAKGSRLVENDYIECYEHLMPELCGKYAPQTFYWPSSPSSGGGFDDPTSMLRGDSHYWDVWHGGIPFTEYRKHTFRFCSEYGFEAYPSIKTINSFCAEEDKNCFSRVMENHQKCKSGNAKILTYLADTYLYPTTFEKLVYASQMLQADAIKYGVEHFRRQRGICMGSIYWQFNDCWPVCSWSSVDYYGRYKALHYAAKKFYSPVAMGLFYENGKLTVNVSNETMEDFEGSVCYTLADNENNVLETKSVDITIDKLESADCAVFKPKTWDEYSNYIYVDLYDKDGSFIMRQTQLFVAPKHFSWKKPDIKAEFNNVADGVELIISSDVFAKGVCIDFENCDCIMSDNYVDLTNAEPYRIHINTDYDAKRLEKELKIMSVYDIGK